jgi:hypothetical protein
MYVRIALLIITVVFLMASEPTIVAAPATVITGEQRSSAPLSPPRPSQLAQASTPTAAPAPPAVQTPSLPSGNASQADPQATTGPVINTIDSIRTVQSHVEIQLTSSRAFPVRNEIAVLKIGREEVTLSRYPEDGSTNTLIFTLTAAEFDHLQSGDEVTVQYGRYDAVDRWYYGKLDKARWIPLRRRRSAIDRSLNSLASPPQNVVRVLRVEDAAFILAPFAVPVDNDPHQVVRAVLQPPVRSLLD